jgi:flagellar biosynthesis protein FlhA
VLGQLGAHPKALFVASLLMFILGILPGLPAFPFFTFGIAMTFVGIAIPRRLAREGHARVAQEEEKKRREQEDERHSVRASLATAEIELCLGKQLSAKLFASQQELAHRVNKMRKKFALEYGFVVPEIKVTDDISIAPKLYQIRIHGTTIVSHELRVGESMVILGDGQAPDVPGEELREPAFGMRAYSVPETFATDLGRRGFRVVDNMSVLLTHLSEVVRNNLAQLLSYKDMRALLDRLGPEYRKLLDDICPAHLSYSGLQAVLKLLLAERVSIRNLHLILEAVAEVAPHVRRAEQLVEHVRMRIAQQLCGDLSDGGVLKVLRLGNRWDLAFHQSLKRDGKGEVVEFDIDPRLLEQFGAEASTAIRKHLDAGERFVLVTAPEARPYVRMIIERLFATLPVLSHVEIARGIEVKSLGTIS